MWIIELLAGGFTLASASTCIEQWFLHFQEACFSSYSFRTVCYNAVQGRLLQLRLPCEVRPDSSKAERSTATGHLLITMPKEDASSGAGWLAHAR